MPKQRVRKGNHTKKNLSYEGEQYRGGRVEGRKNLVKGSDGTLTNKHGVTFTQDDKKALERAVNRSNYQRKKALAEWVKKSEEKGQHYAWGKDPEFIVSRQSKSLQRFHSREDFERYLKKQEDIQSGAYRDYRTDIYKENYAKGLIKEFGADGEEIKEAIMKMDRAKFRELVENEKLEDINFIYGAEERERRLNRLRAQFSVLSESDYIEPI